MSNAFPRPTGRTPWDDSGRPAGGEHAEGPDRGFDSATVNAGPDGARPDDELRRGAVAWESGQDRRQAPAAWTPSDRPEDAGDRRVPDEIERAVPVVDRIRPVVQRGLATVRSSIPVRTVLFLLPPLVLPAVAFDLSLGAAVAVTVLLLWVVVAAAVVATMMFDGTDVLALRAIARRIDELASSDRPAVGRTGDEEALLALGAQLDALNDRLDVLTAASPRPPAELAVQHRPQEQWPASGGVGQNDGYDHDVASGRHWSPPRWQR